MKYVIYFEISGLDRTCTNSGDYLPVIQGLQRCDIVFTAIQEKTRRKA